MALEQLEYRQLLTAVPEMVADINMNGAGSVISEMVDVGGTLFFVAASNDHGRELWKSDGTAAGTVLIKDIFPGVQGSYPGNLVNVDGTLFFTANDSANGRELWRSDGTNVGTVLVKDINPGFYPYSSYPASGHPVGLTNVDGTLFFSASDGTNGSELWKSDGTAVGTVLVKDINPGLSGPYGSFPFSGDPADLTNVDGTLFFSANDGSTGRELWKSDGTNLGTVLVKDINPGSYSGPYGTFPYGSYPSQLVNINGTLFLSANDGVHGRELWKSDGTEAGTILVKDINPSVYSGPYGSFSFGSYPDELTSFNGTLLFSADDGANGRELWKSDGTEAGTVLVKNINPGVYSGPYGSFPYSSSPLDLTTVAGSLFFTANDGASGRELWKSDGTEAGTVMVKDIQAGLYSAISYDPINLTDVAGTLFFTANDGIHGRELWKSDGTLAGTVFVKDIRPGEEGSIGYGYYGYRTRAASGGRLFLLANDGAHGKELWTSDGTEAGTVLVKDLNSGTNSSYARNLTNIDDTLIFAAYDGVHGTELWTSDGTQAGTMLLKDIGPGRGGGAFGLTKVGQSAFFTANDGVAGYELWRTDGTEAGTVLVKDIRPDTSYGSPYSSFPYQFADVNGTAYFSADDGPNGRELWKSDGTEAGTVLVKDIRPGLHPVYLYPAGSRPYNLTNLDGTLFFVANDGVHGPELWKSDGSQAGTVLVKDIRPGSYTGPYRSFPYSSYPRNLINVNGTLFFTADDGANGRELWKCDGTEAGTMLVKNIADSSPYFSYGSYPYNLTVVDGTLFFSARDGENGRELWTSDGTEAGTVLLKDIRPGSSGSYAYNLTNVNGTLFFSASDDEHGRELWQSDGTTAGTTLLKDIRPGFSGSYPSGFAPVDDVVFFSAATDQHAFELWQTDGTTAGTVMVADINPGTRGSYPYQLTSVGGKLYFIANDGLHGGELWVLRPPTASADSYTVDESGALIALDALGTATVDPNDNGLLSNDADPTSSPLSVYTTPVSGPSHGEVTLNADGTFVYTPDVGFSGVDSFEYRVTNGSLSSTATATISVLAQAENSVNVVNCACDPTGVAKALVVKGSSVDDKIDVKLDPQKGQLRIDIKSGNGPADLKTTVADTDIRQVIVQGLGGNDDINVKSSSDVQALLFGGTGDDKLTGGTADDVLVGGEGNDQLKSLHGRDLLFGGLGADDLHGDQDQDILVSGPSSHDNNLTALNRLLDEWSTNVSFASRVDHLMGGSGGRNGEFFLNAGDAANPYSSQIAVSVFDDDAEDKLTGGPDEDWFIANLTGAGIKDKTADRKPQQGEVLSELS